MKRGKYAKTLAKVQVRGVFPIRDIRRNVLPKFIEICIYGDATLVLIRVEHQRGARKPTETSVTEFCYKSVNLPLEELINIKVTFFLILELFR